MEDTLLQILEPLTAEQIRELWSKTYNKEGKPDWSHIFPYYHDDIVFEDSIQRIEGITDFKAMCARLTKRCEQLNMDIQSITRNAETVFIQWKMTMIFNKFQSGLVYADEAVDITDDVIRRFNTAE